MICAVMLKACEIRAPFLTALTDVLYRMREDEDMTRLILHFMHQLVAGESSFQRLLAEAGMLDVWRDSIDHIGLLGFEALTLLLHNSADNVTLWRLRNGMQWLHQHMLSSSTVSMRSASLQLWTTCVLSEADNTVAVHDIRMLLHTALDTNDDELAADLFHTLARVWRCRPELTSFFWPTSWPSIMNSLARVNFSTFLSLLEVCNALTVGRTLTCVHVATLESVLCQTHAALLAHSLHAERIYCALLAWAQQSPNNSIPSDTTFLFPVLEIFFHWKAILSSGF
jgi:hypothetical protein